MANRWHIAAVVVTGCAVGAAGLAVGVLGVDRHAPDNEVGLPAGGEFALMAVTTGMMYWAARDLGAEVQAGVGVGFRINQMQFVLVVSVAMAAAPLAGQNYGARNGARVRETLRTELVVRASCGAKVVKQSYAGPGAGSTLVER